VADQVVQLLALVVLAVLVGNQVLAGVVVVLQ
jgi:hypothetical protein